MRPEASSALIGWFGERAARAVLAAYEMVGPNDPFGRTMLENLRKNRGLTEVCFQGSFLRPPPLHSWDCKIKLA